MALTIASTDLTPCQRSKSVGLALARKQGKFCLQRISFDRTGRSAVEPLTSFVTIEEIGDVLQRGLTRSEEVH